MFTLFSLAACDLFNPMIEYQTFPAQPLALRDPSDYAPLLAGCTLTRTRLDPEDETEVDETLAEYDPDGRLLYSRVLDMNGVEEATNTWNVDCLTFKELRYEGSAWDEDRSFLCDEHGHPRQRTSTYFSDDDQGERAETFGTDDYTYELSYSGTSWTEWNSPTDGWSYELDFAGTHLVSATWDYYQMSIVGSSTYTWDDDRLVAWDHTDVDTEYEFTWEYHTTWNYDEAGRLVSRDVDGRTSSWTYAGDDPWPQQETQWTGVRYALTFDCR